MKRKIVKTSVDKLMIISDLDGTLLNSSHQISPINKRAVKEFMAKGGLFTLATGRIEEAALPFAAELGIKVPLILYNGGKIYCPVKKSVLYEKKLRVTTGFLQNLFSLHTEELAVLFYKGGRVYTPSKNILITEYEKKEKLVCGLAVLEELQGEVNKILMIGAEETYVKAAEKIILQKDIECERVYSEGNYIELLPPRVSKGAALLELKNLLPMEEYQIIAIGDQLNDLSLIQEADLGAAVENAHEKLKKKADLVTAHHEEDAVAQLIKTICL